MTATTTKPPKPPGKPPTATATGYDEPKEGRAAFGLVVPLPPGWQVGALEFVVPADAGRPTWRRTLQTHATNCDRTPVLVAVCESDVPAHATALAIASAWAQYQSEHPSGSEAAAQAGCRVPHPQPAGGIRTQTVLRLGDSFPVRVTFPNALTLIDSVPELVRLDDGRRPAWYTERAADAITEHGIFPEPYRPDPAGTFPASYLPGGIGAVGAPITDPADPRLRPDPEGTFTYTRRRMTGEPITVPLTFNLTAVGEDFDGTVKPLADLTPGPKPAEQEAAQARFVADVLNGLKSVEVELAELTRTVSRGGGFLVAFSTTPGVGFVPAYPVRRRAENLAPGATPVGLAPAFHGHVEFNTVRGDQCGAIWPAVCRYTTAVPEPTAAPAPLMLSSFYRPDCGPTG